MPTDTSRQTLDWQQRLDVVIETMREMSRHTDPQEMVRAYSRRIRQILPVDGMIAISRRGLEPPFYHITRSSRWTEEINPWKDKARLPVLAGGLLGELLYAEEPRLIDDLPIAPDDPAAEYFEEMRSLIAIPHFDHGHALNMVVLMRREPGGFPHEEFPEQVWTASLFGRAAQNLVLSQELKEAYATVDHELKVVENIQRSLLPSVLPDIPTMGLAAHYQTSRAAGGDYYDFFPLPDDKWGILIADVSGHGTPAAVIMAITHSIAHTHPGPPTPPCRMLDYLNRVLSAHYTALGAFVTAFYGIYDPRTRELTHASAGHNPPRVKRCDDGSMLSLDGPRGLPLGVDPGETYGEASHVLRPGDQIIFYTDGITEAHGPSGELFGISRLDAVLHDCRPGAQQLIDAVLDAVDRFTGGSPAGDDRTLLVAKIT